MGLYCNLMYTKCFDPDCDGWWCSEGDRYIIDGRVLSIGSTQICYLHRDKYGVEPFGKGRKIKLISEFEWLVKKAVYEESKK